MKLSKRLLSCANYTQGFNKLADIGTDHAKLPIHCINEGYVSKALAIDNKEGPFVIAYANVTKAKLHDKITVIKSDGIKDIDNEVDVIVISGMGGTLISDIITKHPLNNAKRIIMQPNCDANIVRHSINSLGYKIIDELVILDEKKYYDIIVCELGTQSLNPFEEEFGPINLQTKPHYFLKRLNKEQNNLKRILTTLTEESHRISVTARLKLIEEVLK